MVLGLARHGSIPPAVTLFLAVGVLGGFTTFSAFSYETLQLISSGNLAASFFNVAGQFAVSLMAVYLGFVITRVFPVVA